MTRARTELNALAGTASAIENAASEVGRTGSGSLQSAASAAPTTQANTTIAPHDPAGMKT